MEFNLLSFVLVSLVGLVSFFEGNWVTSINKSRKEQEDSQNKLSLYIKEHEMNMKRIDSETKVLRNENKKIDIKLKEGTLGLQKDLRTMASSIEQMLKTTITHDIEIRETREDVKQLKEENKFITEHYIRKNQDKG